MNDIFRKLKGFMDALVSSDEFSGSVLIMKNSIVAFEFSSGFVDRKSNTLNKINTKFNIGSMDKMFTAVSIGQLVQNGKLDFDDNIGKYISDFPSDVADKMTIDYILSHKDGFPSYFNDKYIETRLKLKTVNDYIKLFKDEPLLFEPGEKYQYSNSGYVVLGAIIEAVTGMSYYDYVREKIFDIAEMKNTGSFDPSGDNPKVAQGYTKRKKFSQQIIEGSKRNNISELPAMGSPAGGGYSTCEDLYKFSVALLENKLLNPEMTDLILTPKVTVGTKEGTTLYYGYGFQILDVGDGNHRFGHAGGLAGANSRLDMYPWLDYTVVVLANYDQPAAFRVANKIGELIFRD